jgi:cell division protein FtsW (lipid II flippase)
VDEHETSSPLQSSIKKRVFRDRLGGFMESKWKKFDLDLMFLVFVFMIISCVSIYSAQKYLPYEDNFAIKQCIWFIGGYFDLHRVLLRF